MASEYHRDEGVIRLLSTLTEQMSINTQNLSNLHSEFDQKVSDAINGKGSITFGDGTVQTTASSITLTQFNALEARITAVEHAHPVAIQLKTPNIGHSWTSISLIDNTGVNHLSGDGSYWGTDQTRTVYLVPGTSPVITMTSINDNYLYINDVIQSSGTYTIPDIQITAGSTIIVSSEPFHIPIQLKTPNIGQPWSSITLIDDTGVNHLSGDSSYWGRNQTRTVNLSPGTSPVITMTMTPNSEKVLFINGVDYPSGNYTIPESQITFGSTIIVYADFDD